MRKNGILTRESTVKDATGCERISQPHLNVCLEREEDVGEEPLVDVRPPELRDPERRPRRPGAELGALLAGAVAGALPVAAPARGGRWLLLLLLLLFLAVV